MPKNINKLRIAWWLMLPLFGLVFGAFCGALLGSLIGESLGSAEGEGFIGFLYGIRIGPLVGVGLGAFAAWRMDRRALRRS